VFVLKLSEEFSFLSCYCKIIPTLNFFFFCFAKNRCMTGLSTDHCSSGFPTKTICTSVFYPVCATFSIHLILLDFVSVIMFVGDWKL
jgi:hypothetical protein